MSITMRRSLHTYSTGPACGGALFLLLGGLLVALAATGCAASEGGAAADEPVGTFRVRADVTAGLNADAGWAGAAGETVPVEADRPFRLRLEGTGAADSTRLRLQVRRNDGGWMGVEAHDFPYPEEATPRVSIVATDAYAPGAATTNLLDGAPTPFRAGAGIDLAAESPPWVGGDVHGEWEWPVVIRRFADGPVLNEAGDTFAFRIVDAEGRPASAAAEVTLTVPDGHLGGTFVETPGRLGPWQASDGALYFIMEPAETDNVMMVVKSTDGGTTWREVDGAHRPAAGDLEGVAADLVGDTIHLLHQTSEVVWHHAFHTADHPSQPDAWAVRDDTVATPGEPPTQVAALAARPDRSLVAFYGGPEKVRLRVRSAEGTWGAETVLDPETAPALSGPQAVLGVDGAVHLAYTASDGTAWYRQVLPDGTLTPRQQIASGLGTTEYDVGSILPLVFLPETNTTVVLYRRPSGHLWARRFGPGDRATPPVQVSDRRVVQNPVDSDQAGGDAIAAGGTVHVLFIEEATGHLYHTLSGAAEQWAPATLVADGVDAQWVRGNRLTRPDGTPVYGFVFDAGSDGGAGMNTYGEVLLDDR